MSKKIVVYTGIDEVLITLKKNEAKFLLEYGDRNFEDDYDREETNDHNHVICISMNMRSSVE